MIEPIISDVGAALIAGALGGIGWAIRFNAISRTREVDRKINSENRVIDALSDLSQRVANLEGMRGLPMPPVGKRAVTRAGFERDKPPTDNPPLVTPYEEDDTNPRGKRR